MDEDLIESECDRHGLERHIFVHEAGHAVAAIDNGIPFRAIVLYDEHDAPKFDGGLTQAAAAVDPGPDPSAWVMPDPLGSLMFVLGGAAAERAVLGHEIPGGYDEDMRVWRRGSGRLDAQTEEQVTEFVGMPVRDAWRSAKKTAIANQTRIEAVAAALNGHAPPWELSHAEVVEILDKLD